MLLDSWGTTSFLWATRKSTAPVRRSRFFSSLPDRRIEVRFGKFSIVDFFDTNTYGTDTTLQFMNWTVDNNGAYDYAADTRGFTFAAMFEYHERRWAVRFAEALMPKVANGIHLDGSCLRCDGLRSSRRRWSEISWQKDESLLTKCC